MSKTFGAALAVAPFEDWVIDSNAATNPIDTALSENWQPGKVLNPAQLGWLYDTYFPRLYNYLSYRTSSREEAEDLVGQVFERVIDKYHTFDPERGAFESWLFTIARNSLTNRKRQQARHPETELGEWLENNDQLSPDQLFLKQEELQRLRYYLSNLNERDRELVALRYGAGLSQRKVGELMKMNETNVAVALGRAVRRLRQMFDSDDQPGSGKVKDKRK